MGGRSSGFSSVGNIDKNKNLDRTDTFDKDKETTRQTEIVKKIKSKAFMVMESSDVIPLEILTPNLEAVDKFLTKNKEYVDFMGENKVYIRAEEFYSPTVQACYSFNTRTKNRMQIIYSKSNFENHTPQMIEKRAENQIKANKWSKSDKDNYINKTILHELSHFVQRVVIEKLAIARGENETRLFNPTHYFDLQSKKMKQDILSIAKKEFNSKTDVISIYGADNVNEFFAEAYSEVLCTKNFKDLSPIAKATDRYMKEIKKEIEAK